MENVSQFEVKIGVDSLQKAVKEGKTERVWN